MSLCNRLNHIEQVVSHSLPKCDYCKCPWHSIRFLQWGLSLPQRLQSFCYFHLLSGTRTSSAISAVKQGNAHTDLGHIGNFICTITCHKINICRIKLYLQDRYFRGYVLWLINWSWKSGAVALFSASTACCKHKPLLVQLNCLASILQGRYSPKILLLLIAPLLSGMAAPCLASNSSNAHMCRERPSLQEPVSSEIWS